MLSFEWREFEAVVERLAKLRHRYAVAAANRVKHHGLIAGLRKDIVEARRVRDQLLHHITARLGTAAAQHERPASDTEHRPPDTP